MSFIICNQPDLFPEIPCTSARSTHRSASQTSAMCPVSKCEDDIEEEDGVIGFELQFEFYPNNIIRNTVLRKRYMIDVRPQDEDYIMVKNHKASNIQQDTNSKVIKYEFVNYVHEIEAVDTIICSFYIRK